MAKELPYFKFIPSEWIEGRITMQNEKTQGLFVQLCAWYWKRNCKIDMKEINHRLIKGKATLKHCLETLIAEELVNIDDNQHLVIDFLDEQWHELMEIHNKKVEAGRKGGQATLKHSLSNKDKDKDKDNRPKHVIFYENQIELSKAKDYQKDYDQFVKFLYGKHPSNIKGEPLVRVLAMKKQVTFQSYVNLRNKMKGHEYKGPGIFDTLLNMEKSDKIQIDVVLTLNTWMFKDK